MLYLISHQSEHHSCKQIRFDQISVDLQEFSSSRTHAKHSTDIIMRLAHAIASTGRCDSTLT